MSGRGAFGGPNGRLDGWFQQSDWLFSRRSPDEHGAMMLQACLNGNRTKTFNARVPCTADELARDALEVIKGGADELHVHPRDADGVETLEAVHVTAALVAIRAAMPAVAIGLSTHWAIPPGGVARQRRIGAWTALPDYVSVNLAEDDAPEVIALALQKGIGVEAGLASVADAQRFLALENAKRCLRVLIEIDEQDEREGTRVANAIIDVLGSSSVTLPKLLHGYEQTKWPLFRYAIALGLDSRIGFEDGGALPTGETAQNNADLIRAARQMIG
jgi:uncharacterized protein (DUF849 family)